MRERYKLYLVQALFAGATVVSGFGLSHSEQTCVPLRQQAKQTSDPLLWAQRTQNATTCASESLALRTVGELSAIAFTATLIAQRRRDS